MSKILIFGGTTEGRLLAEFCVNHQIYAMISVVSEYGQQLLPVSPYLHILHQSLDEGQLIKLIESSQPELILDATHPYAKVITQNLQTICGQSQLSYYRILRNEESPLADQLAEGLVTQVATVTEAVEYLNHTTGAIFVTTGSKELSGFTTLIDDLDRLYARVLPTKEVIEHCQQLGLKGSHLIGMQGPFSKELNQAMLQQLNIRYLVTKEAGKAGGYLEKILAAKECDVHSIVIGRPGQETGISLDQAYLMIKDIALANQIKDTNGKMRIAVIGMGMGNGLQLTQEALTALSQSQIIFGASRLLDSASLWVSDVPTKAYYKSSDILSWLKDHPSMKRVAVVYSGDIGFYSGAAGLLAAFRQLPEKVHYQVDVFPGISSLAYFCAKVQLPWDDLFPASFHGRSGDISKLIQQHQRLFLLLDGDTRANQICTDLTNVGYGKYQVYIGERLSYTDEKITIGRAEEFGARSFAVLSVMIILKN